MSSLYLALFPENVPQMLRSHNKVLAYDLKTGKQLGESSGTQRHDLHVRPRRRSRPAGPETGGRRDPPLTAAVPATPPFRPVESAAACRRPDGSRGVAGRHDG